MGVGLLFDWEFHQLASLWTEFQIGGIHSGLRVEEYLAHSFHSYPEVSWSIPSTVYTSGFHALERSFGKLPSMWPVLKAGIRGEGSAKGKERLIYHIWLILTSVIFVLMEFCAIKSLRFLYSLSVNWGWSFPVTSWLWIRFPTTDHVYWEETNYRSLLLSNSVSLVGNQGTTGISACSMISANCLISWSACLVFEDLSISMESCTLSKLNLGYKLNKYQWITFENGWIQYEWGSRCSLSRLEKFCWGSLACYRQRWRRLDDSQIRYLDDLLSFTISGTHFQGWEEGLWCPWEEARESWALFGFKNASHFDEYLDNSFLNSYAFESVANKAHRVMPPDSISPPTHLRTHIKADQINICEIINWYTFKPLAYIFYENYKHPRRQKLLTEPNYLSEAKETLNWPWN